MFQVKLDDNQETISNLLERPKRYFSINVHAAKIEKPGEDFGKATLSSLVLVPNAVGFIDEDPGNINVAVVDDDDSFFVKNNNILKEIKSWGPTFEITFEIKVKKFTGQVLYLTTGTIRGGGIPEVIAVKNRLEVSTRVQGEILKIHTKLLNINVWYHITISQKPSSRSLKQVASFSQF